MHENWGDSRSYMLHRPPSPTHPHPSHLLYLPTIFRPGTYRLISNYNVLVSHDRSISYRQQTIFSSLIHFQSKLTVRFIGIASFLVSDYYVLQHATRQQTYTYTNTQEKAQLWERYTSTNRKSSLGSRGLFLACSAPACMTSTSCGCDAAAGCYQVRFPIAEVEDVQTLVSMQRLSRTIAWWRTSSACRRK